MIDYKLDAVEYRPSDAAAGVIATEGLDVSFVLCWRQGHSRSSVRCQS